MPNKIMVIHRVRTVEWSDDGEDGCSWWLVHQYRVDEPTLVYGQIESFKHEGAHRTTFTLTISH